MNKGRLLWSYLPAICLLILCVLILCLAGCGQQQSDEVRKDEAVTRKRELLCTYTKGIIQDTRVGYGTKKYTLGSRHIMLSWVPEDAGVEIDYSGGNKARIRWQQSTATEKNGQRSKEKREWNNLWLTVWYNNGGWTTEDPSKGTFRLNE